MKSVWKWLLLVLIILEIALVRLHLLDIRTAIGVFIAIESLLFIVGFRQVVIAVRSFRHDRNTGLDVWEALENGLAVFLPQKMARITASEPKLWYYLGLWMLKRIRRDEFDFTYHRKSIMGPILIVLLFTTPFELLLFELLLPWAWLRWLIIILGIYTFFWICGLYASLVAIPHTLTGTGIRLAYGALAHGDISYEDIMTVEAKRRTSQGEGLKVIPKEDAAYFTIGGNTDVTIQLRASKPMNGWLGPTATVTTVHLAVDEPERLVQELSKHLYS